MAIPHRFFALALCGAMFAALPLAQAAPIANVVNHPIVAAGKTLPIDAIRKNIILAASKRGWAVQEDGQQQLRATISARGMSLEATVSISFSEMAYSITLLSSKGFGQTENSVNGRANRWLRNLEHDIEVQLALAA